MPYICKVCGAEYPGPQTPAGKACFTNKECKAKKEHACRWEADPVAQAELSSEELAASLGYPDRYNSYTDKFPVGHKTNVMFVNAAKTRGISRDGSTHSGGRSGWKGFTKGSGGWSYLGSYQDNLDFWPHRPNDARVAFLRGNA